MLLPVVARTLLPFVAQVTKGGSSTWQQRVEGNRQQRAQEKQSVAVSLVVCLAGLVRGVPYWTLASRVHLGPVQHHMVAQVARENSQGGWTQPRANSLQPLLLLSSPVEEREREREREPSRCIFFCTLHLTASGKMTKFQRGLQFFFVFM